MLVLLLAIHCQSNDLPILSLFFLDYSLVSNGEQLAKKQQQQ